MRQHRLVLAVSITFTVITTILVGLSAGATLAGESWRVLLFSAAGATAAAVIAALAWGALWIVLTREDSDRERDAIGDDRRVLIRKLAGDAGPARRQALPATLPLPRHPFRRAL